MTVYFGPWVLPEPWTVARAHALAVLVENRPTPVRVSNVTQYALDETPGSRPATGSSIYWQSARWLVDNGYARTQMVDMVESLTLTDKGETLRARLARRLPNEYRTVDG